MYENIKVVIGGQLKGFLTLPPGQSEISLGQLLKNWDIENSYTVEEWYVRINNQKNFYPDSLEDLIVKNDDDVDIRRKPHFGGIVGGSYFL